MPKTVDYTNQIIGRWTVLRLDEQTKNTKHGRFWVCQCDAARGGCGREFSVRGSNLWRCLNGKRPGGCGACAMKNSTNRTGATHSVESRAAISAASSRPKPRADVAARNALIRAARKSGATTSEIASRFGVSEPLVRLVVRTGRP